MFSEYLVKTEKKRKDSQRIMFVDLPVEKTADEEDGKFQNSLAIICGASELLFAENTFGGFQNLRRETFDKAKNLIPYLKQHALHGYRYPI